MQAVSNQYQLETVLRQIFPSQNIIVNVKETILKNTKTDSILEFDFRLPDLNIAFEFQDAYHYATTWYSNQPLSNIIDTDSRLNGITLITVPCWWDANANSLLSEILFHRPEVTKCNYGTLIPLNPRSQFFPENRIGEIEGEIMLATQDSPSFRRNLSIHSWWMGEKYDGIRFVWSAASKSVIGRDGKCISVPSFINKSFSHIPIALDGEFWLGRRTYHTLQDMIYPPRQGDWSCMRLLVFEAINKDQSMEKRYETMLSFLPSSFSIIIPVPRILTKAISANTQEDMRKQKQNQTTEAEDNENKDKKELIDYMMREITTNEGEGLILAKCLSLYSPGRSESLVKLKNVKNESEALVLKVSDRAYLQLPSETLFEVNKSNQFQLRAGDVVTVEYESYSRSAIPLNPIIVRTRRDLNWDHVIKNYSHQEPLLDKPKNYWNPRTMRKFMEDFAKQRNKDPLHPHTWYSILRSDFAYEKWPFNFQNVSYVNTVIKLFPELNLEPSKFGTIASGYWNDIKNRRKVIEDYCTRVGIDPLVPSSWNFIEPSSFDNTLKYVLQKHYKGSFTNAISHLYPNVQHSSFSFSSSPVSSSKIFSRKIIRQVFDRFAHENKFNPLVAKNWYSVPIQQILSRKEIYSVIKKSKMGVKAALSEAYPNVVFQNNEFFKGNYIPKQSLKNKKILFDEFAQKHGFDPLNPNNWYQISKKTLLNILRPERKSLSHYQKVEALKTLVGFYPNIGLVVEKFKYR